MTALSAVLATSTNLSEAAQRAVLSMPQLHQALADNRQTTLVEDVWFALWPAKAKLSADLTGSLAARPLSAAQLDHVFRNERRATVVAGAVAHNLDRVDSDTALRLLATKSTARAVAKVIVTADAPDPKLFEAAVKVLGGNDLIGWLATPACSVDEARTQLASFHAWGPKPSRKRSQSLTKLIASKAELIADFARSPELALKQAAAGSRHLRDETLQWDLIGGRTPVWSDANSWMYILLALVNNPVCRRDVIEAVREASGATPGLEKVLMSAQDRLSRFASKPTVTVAFEAVADSEVLHWLIGRSVPKLGWDGDPVPGKPHDVAALAENPNLDFGQAQRLHAALTDWGVAQALHGQLDHLADKLEALHPALAKDRRGSLDEWAKDDRPASTEPSRYVAPDIDVDGYRIAALEHGPAPRAMRSRMSELLETTDEWRVALGLVDSARESTLSDFVDTVRALT